MSIKKIYIDVSDTIALPPDGEEKFQPHEIELRNIVLNDMTVFSDKKEREQFLKSAINGYEEFCTIRRDNEISIEKRYQKWLDPFIGYLKDNHIKELVENWQINETFFEGLRLIDKTINDLINLEITSGNLVNINRHFLNKPHFINKIEEVRSTNTELSIQGIELLFDDNGFYNGKLVSKGELFYSDYTKFPDDCLTIGDDDMVKYGFSKFLINVQTFSKNEALSIIRNKTTI